MNKLKYCFKVASNLLDAFFIWIANNLGTNSCIILFCLIAFVPLFYQSPQTILDWQQYISQTVIQLVALSILAKVAKIESEKSEKRLNEMYNNIKSDLDLQNQELYELKEIKNLLKK